MQFRLLFIFILISGCSRAIEASESLSLLDRLRQIKRELGSVEMVGKTQVRDPFESPINRLYFLAQSGKAPTKNSNQFKIDPEHTRLTGLSNPKQKPNEVSNPDSKEANPFKTMVEQPEELYTHIREVRDFRVPGRAVELKKLGTGQKALHSPLKRNPAGRIDTPFFSTSQTLPADLKNSLRKPPMISLARRISQKKHRLEQGESQEKERGDQLKLGASLEFLQDERNISQDQGAQLSRFYVNLDGQRIIDGNPLSFRGRLDITNSGSGMRLGEGFVDAPLGQFNLRLGLHLLPFSNLHRFHEALMMNTASFSLLHSILLPVPWSDEGLATFWGNEELRLELYLLNGLEDRDRTLDLSMGLKPLVDGVKRGSDRRGEPAKMLRLETYLNSTRFNLIYYHDDLGSYSLAGLRTGSRNLSSILFEFSHEYHSRVNLRGSIARNRIQGDSLSPEDHQDAWTLQADYPLGVEDRFRIHCRGGAVEGGKNQANDADREERVIGLSYTPGKATVLRLERFWHRVNTRLANAMKKPDGYLLQMGMSF